MTGKTTSQNIDDATITALVKANLANQQEASTLTCIGVHTDRGIVDLDGIAPDEDMREQAADIAQQVARVQEVVCNPQIE